MIAALLYSPNLDAATSNPDVQTTAIAIARANLLPAGTYYLVPTNDSYSSASTQGGLDADYQSYGTSWGVKLIGTTTLSATGSDVFIAYIAGGTTYWVKPSTVYATGIEATVVTATPGSTNGLAILGLMQTSEALLQTRAAITTVSNFVDTVEGSLGDATNGLAAIKTAVNTAISQTDTLEASLADGTNGLAAIKTVVNTVAGYTDSLETTLADGTNGLAAIKTAVNTVAGYTDTLEAGITDIQNAQTAHSTTLGTINTNVSSVKSTVENATFGLSAIENLVDDIESALANATTGLSAIKTAVDSRASQSSVTTLTTNVATAQTDVTAIKSRIADVRAILDGLIYA